MKLLFAFLAVFIGMSSSAFASGTFTKVICKTDDAFIGKTRPTFSFGVKNLYRGKLSIVSPIDGSDDWEPVKTRNGVLSTLNDNTGWTRTKQGIEISGDFDGIYTVDVGLYADKNYTRGYVRVNDRSGDGPGNQYGTITCTLKSR